MLVLAAVNDTSYNLLLVLHLLAVVIAFAPVVVGLATGRDGGASWASVRSIRTVFAPAVIVAGLLGIILVLVSDDAGKFSQAWVSVAFLVWIAMVGVYQALVLRGARAGGTAGTRQTMLGAQILGGLLVVMVFLMVFRPGV